MSAGGFIQGVCPQGVLFRGVVRGGLCPQGVMSGYQFVDIATNEIIVMWIQDPIFEKTK